MCKGYHQGLPYLWYINCHKSHIKQPSKGKLHGLKGKTEKCNQSCTFLFYFEVAFYRLWTRILTREFITLPDYYMHVSGWVVYTVNHIQLMGCGIDLLYSNTTDAIHTPIPVIEEIKAITTRIVRKLFFLMRSAKRGKKKINVLQIPLGIWVTDCFKLSPAIWSGSSHSEMIIQGVKNWVHDFDVILWQNLNQLYLQSEHNF